jgi:hypothetical protein
MRRDSPSEITLKELGVTAPEQIDLDAIAWHLGVQVKYKPLDGCEARLIGNEQRAVATINKRSSFKRQRFSLGHELGHWFHHKGRVLICRSDEIGNRRSADFERTADRYAANLLLPWYLFRPISRDHPFSFRGIDDLGELFGVSMTATAIRVIESGHTPGLLVCHGKKGRKSFRRGPGVPERWFPQNELDADSYAFDVLFGDKVDKSPHLIDADAWFDRQEARRYEIREQSVKVVDSEVLTLLEIIDGDMLEET